MQKRSFIFALLIGLTACGFHLRETNHLPPYFTKLDITPDTPWSAFQRELRQQLQVAGAHFSKNPDYLIVIKNESESTNNLAYGANGQVNRVRIQLSIDFEVHNKDAKPLSATQHIMVSRDYGVNPNSQLSSDDEKRLIVEEIRKEAAAQMINRLMSVESAP